MTNEKPTHAKPQLYAWYFMILKEVAREHGYNLLIDGSMGRDLDLIAIPWAVLHSDELVMINALSKIITGKEFTDRQKFLFSILPNRNKYVIKLNRGGYTRNEDGDIVEPITYTEDPQYYIDISVIRTNP